MKKPQEWNTLLAPEVSNATAWNTVGVEAKKWLITNVRAGDMVSTTTLAEALYPAALARQSDAGVAARLRIFDALRSKYADKYELNGCLTFDNAIPGKGRFKGKMIVPRLWHPPQEG